MGETRTLIAAREKTIIRTSIIGIGANILLAAFKAIVGVAANSVAIISDAVNNLTDALSSIITIVGTHLAAKAPDKKHPMGHGRAEYMSALVVSAIVFYAGATTLIDSVKKIIHPEKPEYGTSTVILLVAAIIVKIVLGAYTKAVGKKVNSGSLVASGEDASNDAILSASVLASAIVFMVFGIALESYVGILISIMIIKASYEMISEAVSELLGARADKELTSAIKRTIAKDSQVHGVYDLILNNYGPNRYLASVHVEVDSTLTAADIDALTRRLQDEVYRENSVILAAVGIYSFNMGNDAIGKLRSDIRSIVMSFDGVLQTHGFYLDEAKNTISFDMIVDFAYDRKSVYNEAVQAVKDKYPEYSFDIALDTDFSD